MTPRNEDFLFAQEAQRQGFITDQQIEQGFRLQERMSAELQLDERLSVILVKRGWMAEEQARRVYRRLEPEGKRSEIEGYDIVEKLGSGSMGTVYKAMHRALGRPVAIKILRGELAKEHMHVERLKEEAKLLASLDHPNIVRALDAGESGGFPFVVMEYVEGESLKDRIARRGPLREVDALKIARAMADALERARRMGVVHRDVKPGNIVLSRQGEAKLMDLGLAKGPVDLGLTQHGATVGTPQFISPEQAQDPRRADTRSDIYSLGATLYAMLSGRPPFSGKTLAEVISKVLYQEPTPLRVLNRDVSPETAYLVERMMLKDPALRYRTPAEVVRDIDHILAGRSIMPAGFRGNWEAHLLRRRYRRWTRVGAVAALVLVVGFVGFVLWRERVNLEERTRRGTEAVAAALAQTTVEPASDDPSSLEEKLAKARSALELWDDVSPERLDELEARVIDLTAEGHDYQRFLEEVEPEVDALVRRGVDAFGTAKARLDAFEDRIDRPRSAVRRRVNDRLGLVVSESNRRFLEVQQGRNVEVPGTFEEAGRILRDHAGALAGDFVVNPDVLGARREAEQALGIHAAIARKLDDLEARFAPDAVRERMEAFEFDALRRELESERRLLEADVEELWREPERLGFGSASRMARLVRARLDAIDRVLNDQVEAVWQGVRKRAWSLADGGDYATGLALLDDFRDAVTLANYRALRLQATDARTELEDRQRASRARVARELDRLLADVRDALRAADPQALRARVASALQGGDATSATHADVAALARLAEAQERLLASALDHVQAHRRLEDVRLKDGDVERRWTVERVDRPSRTVTVLTSSRGRPEARPLARVHPDQLAAWAAPAEGPLDPALEVVVGLMKLDEAEPADLRPRIEELTRLVQAMERADVGGALLGWARDTVNDLDERQRRREEQVREEWASAEHYVTQRRYDAAHVHLRRLLRPDSAYRFTASYEEMERGILDLLESVERQLSNKRLAQDFPAARITSEGDLTSILYDWESLLQLEIFRSGVGRACAVVEPYPGRGVVTPGSTHQRLHLLRGAEGLVRDCPMVLPSCFDPAYPIHVEFDLYTGTSPFFFAVDVDGLQLAVLSADPTSVAYRARWAFPPDAPVLPDEKDPPEVDWYGKGRGVAFHAGPGFGDPTDTESWDWPTAGFARNRKNWKGGARMDHRLFAFEANRLYKVRIERSPGRLALHVDGQLVVERTEEAWRDIGHATDGDRPVRQGTGKIQLWTWTPMSLDDLRLSGRVLERHR